MPSITEYCHALVAKRNDMRDYAREASEAAKRGDLREAQEWAAEQTTALHEYQAIQRKFIKEHGREAWEWHKPKMDRIVNRAAMREAA